MRHTEIKNIFFFRMVFKKNYIALKNRISILSDHNLMTSVVLNTTIEFSANSISDLKSIYEEGGESTSYL